MMKIHWVYPQFYDEKFGLCLDSPGHLVREGNIEWQVLFGDLYFRNLADGGKWKLCLADDCCGY